MSVAVYTKIESNGTHQLYYHRMVALDDGVSVPTHRHKDEHVTTCHEGEIRVWSETGGDVVLGKGEKWTVPANVAHDIEFRTKGSIAECVLVLRFPDGTPVPDSHKLTPRESVELTGFL